ncbi:microfibril-associated glycoprotein 4 isoform X1 [Drosophila pseudoobscura]|uniref:Microfibril-associated glycoprotein 4 isoform X1 n=1 Tax=Drosophila pseudoobscura pseudoobscura TaxID=46245 RepID=A0A6I8W7T6_DROPS|nr:microfibril-associated glycoprotein 4 isoform X1 [Drosophila pseudoobscura]
MSQMLQLDALVMAMACLTTTQTDLGGGLGMVPPILDNSVSHRGFYIDLSLSYLYLQTSCPISALSGLTTRLQALTNDIASVKEQIGGLQEQLVDLRRSGGPAGYPVSLGLPNAIGSRLPISSLSSLDVDVSQLLAAQGGPGAGGDPKTPSNCLKQQGGVVRIQTRANVEPFFVFCENNVSGGGWTMVVNRYDGSEDFNRKWADYKIGFGSITTEFFIGLDKLHQILSSDNYELLVQLQNRKQELRYALYDRFGIGSESEQYHLSVLGKYKGDAADALRQHEGKKFSTQDRDNDESEANCAAAQSAAFWYGSSCNLSNPFGLYQRLLDRDKDEYKGILWRGFLDGPKGSLKIVRMMVRPRNGTS